MVCLSFCLYFQKWREVSYTSMLILSHPFYSKYTGAPLSKFPSCAPGLCNASTGSSPRSTFSFILLPLHDSSTCNSRIKQCLHNYVEISWMTSSLASIINRVSISGRYFTFINLSEIIIYFTISLIHQPPEMNFSLNVYNSRTGNCKSWNFVSMEVYVDIPQK